MLWVFALVPPHLSLTLFGIVAKWVIRQCNFHLWAGKTEVRSAEHGTWTHLIIIPFLGSYSTYYLTRGSILFCSCHWRDNPTILLGRVSQPTNWAWIGHAWFSDVSWCFRVKDVNWITVMHRKKKECIHDYRKGFP